MKKKQIKLKAFKRNIESLKTIKYSYKAMLIFTKKKKKTKASQITISTNMNCQKHLKCSSAVNVAKTKAKIEKKSLKSK